MYIRIYSGHVAFGHATHVYSHTQGQLNPPSKQHAHDAWTNFILRCMATRSIIYEDKKAAQCIRVCIKVLDICGKPYVV